MWEKCTPLWREAHFQIKMLKNVKNTFKKKKKHLFGPLLEVECGKSERRCGAKHISKSKVLKTYRLGPLFDVQLSFFVASAMDSAPCQK